MKLVCMIEMRTHARNMGVGLKTGGKQHFWYEKFRHLWAGDGELLDHCLLELPPIRCPQPNYTKSSGAIPANDVDFERRTEPSGVEVCEWFPEHGGCWRHCGRRQLSRARDAPYLYVA